jgi:xylose dehydrogenase (NAD/NADP)
MRGRDRSPNNGTETQTTRLFAEHRFRAEADAFADLVAHGVHYWPGATPEESLDIAATLEALVESARTGAALDIEAPH